MAEHTAYTATTPKPPLPATTTTTTTLGTQDRESSILNRTLVYVCIYIFVWRVQFMAMLWQAANARQVGQAATEVA